MNSPTSLRAIRYLLLSASSLSLAAIWSAPALAQNDNTSPPGASQPTASPMASPSPTPQAMAPPVPAQTPQSTPAAQAQPPGTNVLPETRVIAPTKRRQPRTPPPRQVVSNPAPPPAAPTHAQVVTEQNQKLDAARQNTILPPIGATSYELGRQAIEALPQGNNATLDKALLQLPGVAQDSAASGELHVRNEHANLAIRINGVMLPDSIAGGFGQFLDSGIVGSMALLYGALPAQYGLRTAGVLDIQTKADAFNNSGTVSVYGGSHSTITPWAEYGGTVGQTQYYVSGRYFGNQLGIENPTPGNQAIHDRTAQEKGFLYLSTVIDPESRLTLISGVSNSLFQIPNNPGQPSSLATPTVSSFDSSNLNERQRELSQFNVLAYQHSHEDIDYQISYFNRYNQLHFMPDPIGDLIINGIASDVYRQSYVNGFQEDTAWRVADAHTLRFGFMVSAEQSLVTGINTTFLSDPTGVNPQALDPVTGNPLSPVTLYDSSSKLGWLFGSYLQGEWRITNQLTLNAGLRFDQMWQYVGVTSLARALA
nr:TonB-dependent receptor [Bradyrhizobium sp. CB3035]